MLEPDVAITDYILSVQCFCFALLLYKKSANIPWLFLFGSLSVASLTGGTVHGFFPDESAFGYAFLWRTTLIAIGAMAFAAWNVGVAFLLNKTLTERIKKAAIAQFLLFTVIISYFTRSSFWSRHSIICQRRSSCLLFSPLAISKQKREPCCLVQRVFV